MGDFNATRFFADRNRGRSPRSEMDWFNELIDNFALVDMDLEGHKFTYSNKQAIPSMSRINRVLVTPE